jgi:diacylglycerol O-acyltransferase / trehalose O-mycolyltransferase
MTTGQARGRARPLLVAGLVAVLTLSLLAVAAVVTLSRVRVLEEQRLTDRVVDVRLWSPALRARTTVRLLLPPAYAERPEARWPSVYLLHGCCDDYLSWTRSTDIEALSAASDVLVVMPDGGRAGFYSDWLDGPGWETFHTVELPALLADRYRAGDRRTVAGVSMGGLGALGYAARHPGEFRAAASFSGIVHTRLSSDESRGYLGLLRSEHEHPYRLWGAPSVDAAVWAAHNPYDLAPRLASLPLFISVGDGRPGPLNPDGDPDPTEPYLLEENSALRERLTELGAKATFDFYGPGSHDWPYWERELHRAWPMLTAFR